MKRLTLTLTLILSLLVTAPAASAQSARDILGGLGGLLGGGQQSSQSDSTQGGGKSGGLGDLIGGVAGALGLGSQKTSVETLTGTWTYTGPAVDFKSDNLLLKAGGAAASANIEKKLEPYYSKAGLTSLTLTVEADSTFSMKARRAAVSGTIETAADGKTLVFHFKALKQINIGSMEVYTKMPSKDKLEITFDVSRLMTILERVGSLTNNTSIKAATTLLNQYDGLTAGFEMKRTATATSASGK